MSTIKETGCYLCIHLAWYEADYEEIGGSGYYCEKREDAEDFKTFPCLRKLKCREESDKLLVGNNG
jgi:hypothetical protein